jgi:hypothetical protein
MSFPYGKAETACEKWARRQSEVTVIWRRSDANIVLQIQQFDYLGAGFDIL